MKTWGLIVLAFGILLCIVSLSMDTTIKVPSSSYGTGDDKITIPSSRVNNIGLMKDQQNYLMLSGLVSIVGLLMFLFGKNSSTKFDRFRSHDKTCPQCAESVKIEAKICRYCSYKFSDIEDEVDWDELARRVNESNKTDIK